MVEKLKELLLRHKLVDGKPLKCQCGTPVLREENWAEHVARLIIEELE